MTKNEQNASMWLKTIREGNTNDYCFEFLNDALGAAKLAPTDIGSSNQELEQLWKEGQKATALEWLDRIRAGNRGDVLDYTDGVPMLLAKAGYTFADIGTNEAEFERLKQELPPFIPTSLSEIDEEIDGPDLRPKLRNLLDVLIKGSA